MCERYITGKALTPFKTFQVQNWTPGFNIDANANASSKLSPKGKSYRTRCRGVLTPQYISTTNFFVKNSLLFSVLNHFCKRTPSQMSDRLLFMPLRKHEKKCGKHYFNWTFQQFRRMFYHVVVFEIIDTRGKIIYTRFHRKWHIFLNQE